MWACYRRRAFQASPGPVGVETVAIHTAFARSYYATYTAVPLKHAVVDEEPPKHRFQPSKHEARQVARIVRALRARAALPKPVKATE